MNTVGKEENLKREPLRISAVNSEERNPQRNARKIIDFGSEISVSKMQLIQRRIMTVIIEMTRKGNLFPFLSF